MRSRLLVLLAGYKFKGLIMINAFISHFKKISIFIYKVAISVAVTTLVATSVQAAQTIVIYGDSLSAAYGIQQSEGWVTLLQNKLTQQNLDYKVVNAGISGDTTQDGLNRLDRLTVESIDIFVLALGANDMLRGVSPQVMFTNLQQIIDKIKDKNPKVSLLLLGMELPVWVPGERAAAYRNVFRRLVANYDVAFVPFLLEGVVGVKRLNMVDGVHPLAEGYQIIAETVWMELKLLLK